MANTILRIGTRESPLAVWQAQQVQDHLRKAGVQSELVYIKSEGDKDLITPLYALGVQGIFTKALDAALLNDRIDIAVHSMKDVPVQLAEGIKQAAVLKRGNWKDIFVPHPDIHNRKIKFSKGIIGFSTKHVITEEGLKKVGKGETQSWVFPLREHPNKPGELEDVVIATSSVRRIAQWLNYFEKAQINCRIENLRGNVNTRLRKLKESEWHGAIFAAAGLERIGLRPESAKEIDWMLPAPAQGAIMVVCRENDDKTFDCCQSFNDEATALCTKIERDFLKELMGGCSTPIGAIAIIEKNKVVFDYNLLSVDGKEKIQSRGICPKSEANNLGLMAAKEILKNGGQPILDKLRNATK